MAARTRIALGYYSRTDVCASLADAVLEVLQRH
jgi:hypothetical protein